MYQEVEALNGIVIKWLSVWKVTIKIFMVSHYPGPIPFPYIFTILEIIFWAILLTMYSSSLVDVSSLAAAIVYPYKTTFQKSLHVLILIVFRVLTKDVLLIEQWNKFERRGRYLGFSEWLYTNEWAVNTMNGFGDQLTITWICGAATMHSSNCSIRKQLDQFLGGVSDWHVRLFLVMVSILSPPISIRYYSHCKFW